MHRAVLSGGPLKSLQDMLVRIDRAYGDKTAIIEKIKGETVSYSAHELKEKVDCLGTALIDLGLKDKNIALVGENSFFWAISFLAITCGVGTVIPLDRELTDAQLCELMNKGDAEALLCSKTYYSVAQLHRASVEGFICVTAHRAESEDGVFCVEDLIERGQKLIAKGDVRFLDVSVSPDSLASINFTSGTTGANKGVMLTQRNIASNIDNIVKYVPLEDVALSVLPMNHIYELSCDLLPMLYGNTVVCINDSLRHLTEDFKLYKPGMCMLVPLFLEKLYNGIWEQAEKTGQAKKLRSALRISEKLLKAGIDMRGVLFKKARESFGGKLSLIICGGAAAEAKYIKGLSDFGFTVYVGYGLTEASPVAALNTDAEHFPDSCGKPFPGSSFVINEPDENGVGEIFISGENVANGYYNDIVATVDSFENGWFKTGDYGAADENGNLYIKGRKKNLIVLSNGKNVHPEEIESIVSENIPYIREIVVMEAEKDICGKKKKIISALIYINPEDFPGEEPEAIEKAVNGDIGRVNAMLPGYKTVSSVKIVTEDFEKTSTKKIIRQKAIQKYKSAN